MFHGASRTMLELEVRRTKSKGQGVFAPIFYRANELLAVSYVLPFKVKGTKLNELNDYPFDFGKGRDCIAFGVVSFCNHSSHPNARWKIDRKNRRLFLYANTNIRYGEEITIRYGCKLWFKEAK